MKSITDVTVRRKWFFLKIQHERETFKITLGITQHLAVSIVKSGLKQYNIFFNEIIQTIKSARNEAYKSLNKHNIELNF